VTIFKLVAETELTVALRSVFIWGVANGRYDMGIKKALQEAGGVGFRYPACSADAYVPRQAYIGHQRVSYDG